MARAFASISASFLGVKYRQVGRRGEGRMGEKRSWHAHALHQSFLVRIGCIQYNTIPRRYKTEQRKLHLDTD